MPEQIFERAPTAVRPEQQPTTTAAERQTERFAERPQEVAAPRPLQRVQVTRLPSKVPPAAASPARSAKSEALLQIENVMSSDLEEVYRSMTPEVKAKFKSEGEKTAAEVEQLLYKVKVQSKKIFQLLFAWLRIIPGVNKYFLEQEAKLKTDELMRLKQELDRTRADQSVF